MTRIMYRAEFFELLLLCHVPLMNQNLQVCLLRVEVVVN